jgi:hypothetical protein
VRNRIVGHGDVAPDQLLAHPLNFRRHPAAQKEALRGSMSEIGWFKTIIVSKRTGAVLDGHARVEEALFQGLATVPVTWVDVDENTERLILMLGDPITEMAVRDEEALLALRAEVEAVDPRVLAAIEEIIAGASPVVEEPPDGGGPSEDPTSEPWWVWVRCPDEVTQESLLAKYGSGQGRRLDARLLLRARLDSEGSHDGDGA